MTPTVPPPSWHPYEGHQTPEKTYKQQTDWREKENIMQTDKIQNLTQCSIGRGREGGNKSETDLWKQARAGRVGLTREGREAQKSWQMTRGGVEGLHQGSSCLY